MNSTRMLRSLCLGLTLGVAAALPATAKEIKLGVGLPPSHPSHYGLEVFAKTLRERSAGELDVKIFPMSLLTVTQMFSGVRDGVVDAGLVLAPLFPSELPETQLAVELGMLGTNGYAMAGAMTEYISTCQECLEERLRHNQVYLGSSSSDPYAILATKKITSLDELKGKKLRSGAAPWARWAQHFGAVAMNIPSSQVFEAFSQGTVDGGMQLTTDLHGVRLIDVVKHVTIGIPGGTYHGLDNHNVNRNTWRSLTESQRRTFLDAAAMTSAAMTWRYVSDADRNIRDGQQKRIQFHKPSEDVLARHKAFIKADLSAVAQVAAKNFGIKNTDAKVARFQQLVEKWEKLVPLSTEWTPETLADVYHREIFSRIEAKSYGM